MIFFTFVIIIFILVESKRRTPHQIAENEAKDVSFNKNDKAKIESEIGRLNSEMSKGGTTEHELTQKELVKLERDEVDTRRRMDIVTKEKGSITKERAALLHKLGGIMYKLRKYSEVLSISKEILRIHENLDGTDHINTAKALTNVGAVANRLNLKDYCEIVERRALAIIISSLGLNSKEVNTSILTLQIISKISNVICCRYCYRRGEC